MELAKNYKIIEIVSKAHAVAICADLTTVGDRAVQGTHFRTFE
jgi:hypothetical protein